MPARAGAAPPGTPHHLPAAGSSKIISSSCSWGALAGMCLGLCSSVAQLGGTWPGTRRGAGPLSPLLKLCSLCRFFCEKSPAPAWLFLLRGEYNSKMLLGSYFCFQNLNKRL